MPLPGYSVTAIMGRRQWTALLLFLALGALFVKFVEINVLGVFGFNYAIYNHFAMIDYVFDSNPYAIPEVAGIAGDDHANPRLLDYPGLQHLVYKYLYIMGARWGVNGFVVYSFVWLTLALCLVAYLTRRKDLPLYSFFFFLILFFANGLWWRIFHGSYEDKALYIALPFLIFALYRYGGGLLSTAPLLGLLAALNGVSAFLLPVVLVHHVRSKHVGDGRELSLAWMMPVLKDWKIWAAIALFFAVFAIGMLPYYPESLVGWERRGRLENAPPHWFSIWHLYPWYFTGLNRIVMFAMTGLALTALFFRRITFLHALILVPSFFFVFSVTQGGQRIAPLLIIFVYLLAGNFRLSIVYMFTAFVFLSHEGRHLHVYPTEWFESAVQAALMHSCVGLAYVLFLYDVVRRWRSVTDGRS